MQQPCRLNTYIPRCADRVFYNELISNKREWVNCFVKNNEEILPNLAGFSLQEQPEDNSMVANSPAWYNGSYCMPWPLSQSNP